MPGLVALYFVLQLMLRSTGVRIPGEPVQRVLFVPRSALAAGALQNVTFELCEEVRTLMHIEGPGAYRARTSYCGMIAYRFELQTLAVGYELRAR
jgi:hypothetical protein